MRKRNYVCVFAEAMSILARAAWAAGRGEPEGPGRNPRRPRDPRHYHEGGAVVVRRRIKEVEEEVELILSPDPTAYQSRHGLGDRPRLPMARLDMDANPVRTYPLSPPRPAVELYRGSRRPAAADAGEAGPWPAVITR